MRLAESRDRLRLSPENTRVLILTHDVDWPRNGPGVSHILARRDRFDAEVLRRVVDGGFNPYYGVPVVMEVEERFHVRSTFFFRPRYDDGSTVGDYGVAMRELARGGWEIGLHVNDPSTVEQVVSEKKLVENAAGLPVCGSRIHYLKVSGDSFLNLAKAGLRYDSSLSFSKERVDVRNSGCLLKDGLVVFPVTFMDAYLFTYMGLTEETVVEFVLKSMDRLYRSGVQIITLLWHDSSIMMKGGRAYSSLISRLVDKPDIVFLKALDAFELVQKQGVGRAEDQ
jgi:peptidoglycan/xylan/chitin deacetylase (PgdA/CDA1 family)